MAVFLNSFTPLCASEMGKRAVSQYNLNPFIDGSCRREPDFEATYPAITSLCRVKKLIPRLKVGDLVIYVTNKKKYYDKISERRLVAILEVIHLEETHENAMNWYMSNDERISQNIIFENTEPLPADHTHHINGKPGEVKICLWDQEYKKRMEDYSKVAICKIWNEHINLRKPLVLPDKLMKQVFGRIPGTQNPPKLKNNEWNLFQNLILKRKEHHFVTHQ